MSSYLSFALLALLLAVAPGPDTMLTLRNTVAGGRAHGWWTMVGVSLAGMFQGLLAAAGLGALIVHAEPLFQTIRWAGVLYLAYLGISALCSARRGIAPVLTEGDVTPSRSTVGLRQGFLCNITNPKVLVFNLAVLPQFVGTHASVPVLVLYAWTLVVVGSGVLGAIVLAASRAQRLLARRAVNRSIEGATGAVMLGFSLALAAER